MCLSPALQSGEDIVSHQLELQSILHGVHQRYAGRQGRYNKHDTARLRYIKNTAFPGLRFGKMAPTSENAVLAEGAAEAEDGAMLLVRMQCPASVDGHYWSELLVDAGALYVSLSDGGRGTDAEQPIYHAHPPGESSAQLLERLPAETTPGHLTPVWSNTQLEVGFAPDVDVEATLLLAAAVAGETPPRFEVELLGARDWVSQVQSDWAPVELAGCLRILFPWHADSAGEGSCGALPPALQLQPGMAFGTGEHATTQLCVRGVHSLLAGGRLTGCDAMLDFGSGSGVVSRANAVDNGMADRFVAVQPAEEAPEEYELVVANILARTLVQLQQPTLSSRVAAGGTLLLSGIWGEAQAAEVEAAFAPDFEGFERSWQDGWVVISARRRR
ncbi:hypothetical protein EMIHUDRAFT_468605 [Emiliania huxleyi CCMP1516]|uniref:ETFB lysine methyltransferase n=2 Tax=Emiliania huxleyi TaxID=2903 RepID=A0A0D3JZT8_EMIH1|nr:hypothetical protein EMIHUDRAFT_468605 [Emiliania huxleyi CCMP1516]EOD29023.1 hypothetical protein EMIHUDRAFT_468605 [Emiliania huxleyi CCMP1516]|eukprot:XP_005781452.1 hypothetical protein EMIHUDRAFT_468605 [Emiliania huxleyi CCMP1516]